MGCNNSCGKLISKWGIMSIEMERAITSDMAVLHEDGATEFVEHVEAPASEQTAVAEVAETPEEADFSDVLGG